MDCHYYKLANFHIRSPNAIFSPSQLAAGAAAAAAATEIILSDATTNITIIGMKTKAALKATNERLSAAATLVMINAIHFCVATWEINL